MIGPLGRRAAVTLLLAFICWTGLAAQSRADDLMNVGPNPVVDVTMGSGTVTVQTWNRPQVQVVTDGAVNVEHLDPSQVDAAPREIAGLAHTINSVHGPVEMPAELWSMPPLPGAFHDEVQARGFGNTVVTVPNGTALVMAHVEQGRITINNYHGVFYTAIHNGGIFLNHVEGSGYAESLRGRIIATDSTFDRLRARSALSNMVFDRCTAHQIEATSKYGSIAYNNGSFEPGLARFETEHGNIALGVRGGAQIGAHTDGGHVNSDFPSSTQVRGGSNTAEARIEGGGPVVTAASKDGSVYLYNGSIESHPQMQEELRGAQGFGRLQTAPVRGAAPRYAPQPIFRPAPSTERPTSSNQFVPPPPRAQNNQPQGKPPKQDGPRQERREHPPKPPQ